MQSLEELTANLADYSGQLQQASPRVIYVLLSCFLMACAHQQPCALCCASQVEQLLLMDPENEELQEMYNSLQEVRVK